MPAKRDHDWAEARHRVTTPALRGWRRRWQFCACACAIRLDVKAPRVVEQRPTGGTPAEYVQSPALFSTCQERVATTRRRRRRAERKRLPRPFFAVCREVQQPRVSEPTRAVPATIYDQAVTIGIVIATRCRGRKVPPGRKRPRHSRPAPRPLARVEQPRVVEARATLAAAEDSNARARKRGGTVKCALPRMGWVARRALLASYFATATTLASGRTCAHAAACHARRCWLGILGRLHAPIARVDARARAKRGLYPRILRHVQHAHVA
mmetsp:Transcript_2432/g.9674  ORF Transcript_2432/g.9674 Transcript_2432/m.9674 type:complete len:267 (+) Transcript_2432:467-1267(+)